MDGKTIRLNRLICNGKMLCVPLDHGITIENIAALTDFKKTVKLVIDNNASAIIVHKGMVRFLPPLKNTGLIIHLFASTEKYKPVLKSIVCEVIEAISLGADAVSVHVNLGNSYEKEMLLDLARISADCEQLGVPLLAMMYIRDDENNNIANEASEKHSIRIATELGADIVKIGANWSPESLSYIIEDSLVPVVVAGGDLKNQDEFFPMTAQLLKTGILGVSFGRNVFMTEDPSSTMHKLSEIVYNSI